MYPKLQGGRFLPAPSRSTIIVKHFFFDFLELYIELGKVKFKLSIIWFRGQNCSFPLGGHSTQKHKKSVKRWANDLIITPIYTIIPTYYNSIERRPTFLKIFNIQHISCENEKSQSRSGIKPIVEKMGFWEWSQSPQNDLKRLIPKNTGTYPTTWFFGFWDRSQNLIF